MFPDYYKKLGLYKSATKDEIKKSFRRLALLYHPDKNKNPDAHEKFIGINEAYLILINDDARFRYDREYDYHLQQTIEEKAKAKRAAEYRTPEPTVNTNESKEPFTDEELNNLAKEAKKTSRDFAKMAFNKFSEILIGATKLAAWVFGIGLFAYVGLIAIATSTTGHSGLGFLVYPVVFFIIQFAKNGSNKKDEDLL